MKAYRRDNPVVGAYNIYFAKWKFTVPKDLLCSSFSCEQLINWGQMLSEI